MGYWGSGPGMIEEPELEEGEAYHCKDDTTIDPDVALSYIGDKVQSILGHFQKDFEGAVLSAENLGAKFGGYGSFLPMHQRSPLSKSPARVQTPNLHGSSNHISNESCGPNSSIPVHMGPSAPGSRLSMGPSKGPKASVGNDSIKKSSSADFDRVETLPEKVGVPLKKMDNPLMVRIKVAPSILAQYNALGLLSPSIPGDSSSEESDGLAVESHSDSPANILQMMTSFPVDGFLLLSPLCDDLLNLLKEKEYAVDSDNEAAFKSFSVSNGLLMTDVSLSKKMKTAGKGENFAKSENKPVGKNSRGPTPECLMAFHDLDHKHLLVMEPEKDVQVRKKRESKDKVKGRAESSYSVKAASLENTSDKSYNKYKQPDFRCNSAEKVVKNRARTSYDDIFADHGQGGSSGNRNHASFEAYPDISEGKRVKGALHKSSAKVGLQYNSGEEGESRLASAVNNLLSEKNSKGSQSSGKLASKAAVNLRDGGSDASKNKCSVKNVHLVKNDLANISSEYEDNMKLVTERPPGVLRKKSNIEAAKTKSTHAGDLKDASTKQQCLGSLTSLTNMTEPSIAAISSNEGIVAGLGQTIEEDWVGCDNCQKWRLLPYGRMSKELPDKWMCSMLDWLPGMNMNRCDVSEDETTKAVQPSYPPNTVSQYSLQANADNNTNLGVISASFDQSHQNFASDYVSDQVKKQKLKQKQNRDSTNNVPSNNKNNLQRHSLQMGSAKESNQSFAGQNAKNKLDLKHTNKSATLVSKLTKRKNEHVICDDTNPRKRMRKESFQDTNGMMMTKIKVSGEPNLDNKAVLKDGQKMNTEQVAVSAGKGKIILIKKPQYKMQDLPDNGALVQKSSNGREVANLKRKFNDHEDSQHQVPTLQDNGKVSSQEQKKDGDFHRDKKSRLSHVEEKEKESKRREGDVVLKIKGVDSGVETDQQVRKLGAKGKLTVEDLVKLRKDLGCEEPLKAATSSSSKVSDTRKNKIPYMDVKSSPDESISSSPARIPPYPNHESPMVMESEAKINSRLNRVSTKGTVKKSSDMKGKTSNACPVLDFWETGARENSCELASGVNHGQNKEGLKKDNTDTILSNKNSTKNFIASSSVKISSQMEDKRGDLCPKKPESGLVGSLKMSSVDSRKSETSVVDDSAKSLKDTDNFISQIEAEKTMAANKNVSNLTGCLSLKKAKDVLREAEEHRNHAVRIKKAGFGSESNYECFRAALKFLHGASLLEACNGVNGKNVELNPMEMYGTAATLCKTCACEYERDHEVAAAALVYKCLEVACMRVVHIKSSTTQKVWLDLQSSLHMVPQGESPSSSASDVDNLNNSAMADKTTLSKGNVSHSVNHDIAPRNRPSFLQLFDFTRDAISAMEAAKKSQEMLTAACVKDSHNKEAIISVKRVIDFSFQDTEEFIRLIRLAFSTINTQSLS